MTLLTGVKLQFYTLRDDRRSEEFGPFEWIQITYDTLRVSGDRYPDFFACMGKDCDWHIAEAIQTPDRGPWSDISIFAIEEKRKEET